MFVQFAEIKPANSQVIFQEGVGSIERADWFLTDDENVVAFNPDVEGFIIFTFLQPLQDAARNIYSRFSRLNVNGKRLPVPGFVPSGWFRLRRWQKLLPRR